MIRGSLAFTLIAVVCWARAARAQEETTTPAADEPPPAGGEEPAAEISQAGEEWTLKPPRVFGFMQSFYRYSFETGDDGEVDAPNFRIQRVRIGVEGELLPWLGYDVEIDPRAPEVTGILRDAFLAVKVIPRHEIRIGQQKTQFGYENPESSSKLFAVNRTEVSDNLSRGGVTLRDIGVGLIGNVKVAKGVRIEDAVTVVNGNGMNTQDDDTRGKDVWGRIGVRYKRDQLGNLVARLGVSGARGDYIDEGDDPLDPDDDFHLEFRRLGTDVEVDHDWFFVSAELVGSDEDNLTDDENETVSGWYVNLVGKTPWLPWELGPILRYDVLGDEFRRWTFGAYYGLPEAPLRVMLNFELRDLKDGERGDDRLYLWAQARF